MQTFSVATPLDGTLTLPLRAAKGESVTLDVLSSSTRLVRKTGRTLSASTTICGQRSLGVRVTRKSGVGTFRIALTRP